MLFFPNEKDQENYLTVSREFFNRLLNSVKEFEKCAMVYKARSDKMYDLLIRFSHIDEANEIMNTVYGEGDCIGNEIDGQDIREILK